jgi:CDP-glucose 4,6-dehydratase
LEGVVAFSMLRSAFESKRVFITGHTGFKGAWLTRWLLAFGAEVAGYSLPPLVGPETLKLPVGVGSLFDELKLSQRIRHIEGDICDLEHLSDSIQEFQPEFVFHLAAQSLVRISYDWPVETFRTNVDGTIHLLESLRRLDGTVIAVIVTSDKCYENRELSTGYSEDDRLGGHDPYSCSKAMCELAAASFRDSFFSDHRIRMATARAGNVIGGGDWAIDRIVPDCMRALRLGEPITVRNPHSVRPWQHVLEPLSGYLQLAAAMERDPARFCTAFNFGPNASSNRSVGELVKQILVYWPGSCRQHSLASQPHETKVLTLSTEKARQQLGWQSRWDFERTLQETVGWYRQQHADASIEDITLAQIEEYQDNCNFQLT